MLKLKIVSTLNFQLSIVIDEIIILDDYLNLQSTVYRL